MLAGEVAMVTTSTNHCIQIKDSGSLCKLRMMDHKNIPHGMILKGFLWGSLPSVGYHYFISKKVVNSKIRVILHFVKQSLQHLLFFLISNKKLQVKVLYLSLISKCYIGIKLRLTVSLQIRPVCDAKRCSEDNKMLWQLADLH